MSTDRIRSSVLIVLLAVCCIVSLSAYVAITVAAEASPSRARSHRAPAQPDKRTGQTQIIAIVDGHPKKAVELCEEFLATHPGHLESLFNLTLAWCQLGELGKALESMDQAIASGLPPERFLAGPRRLLQPLAETDALKRLAAEYADRLLHGPMVGSVTDRSVKFWVRTVEEVPLQVVLSTHADLSQPIESSTVFSEADCDYTAVAEVQRLQPDTQYYYDVLVRGKSTLGPQYPAFRTFPEAGQPARFTVGFGGGAGYTPKHERMWNTIGSHNLTAFLFLGDNVYIDNPQRPDVQHYTYYRRQSRPEYRRFVASTPVFAIWDDHDFGVNDCFYGAKVDDPPWKIPVWEVFRNNWNNPGYGGGRRQPGCWFRFSIADVDFFMLDGRYYRTNPRRPDASMLGRAQKAWLLKQLRRSEATFRVLASPVPWVLEAKGDSRDTWRGFQAERQEIFNFLSQEKIDGVVLISADRHRSDLWRIEREQDYPLYEFESSRLSNIHTHAIMPGALFGYNKKCSFGMLSFDTTKPDPELTYRIASIDDELIYTYVVKRSEISR